MVEDEGDEEDGGYGPEPVGNGKGDACEELEGDMAATRSQQTGTIIVFEGEVDG